jgi:hypothetical protein
MRFVGSVVVPQNQPLYDLAQEPQLHFLLLTSQFLRRLATTACIVETMETMKRA